MTMSVPLANKEENGVSSESFTFTLNGNSSADSVTPSEVNHVPPEMMFKISKKIAQLTKVIYSLNTRNDDLEQELAATKINYEEKIRVLASENHIPNGEVDGSKKNRSKTPEVGDSETKKELRRAKHIMKQLEAKMRAMQEEQDKSKAPDPGKTIPDKQVRKRTRGGKFGIFSARVAF